MSQNKKVDTPHVPLAKHKIDNERTSIFMRLLKIFLLLFFICAIATTILAYKVYKDVQSIEAFVVPAREEPYILKEGYNLSRVVKELTQDKYYAKVIDIWIKFNHTRFPVIQKGPYLIDGQKTIGQILSDMRDGNIVKIKLPTVPLIEGMNISHVFNRFTSVEYLVQDPNFKKTFYFPVDFIEKVLTKGSDKSLLEAIGGTHISLEGLLMPATYDYEPNKTSNLQLLEKALVKMAEFLREHYIERDMSIDKYVADPYQVLILASLVERESSLEYERPLIAQVFFNRLRKGIKLQTDPAVMYGVSPSFRGPILRSQLKKDTPYNTYTRLGLPPTPIAMPSESAILAVLHPEPTDALFFVAKSPDPKDGHYFSKNLKEHNQAVQKYRKAVREYKINLEQNKNNQDNADIINIEQGVSTKLKGSGGLGGAGSASNVYIH